MQTVKEIFAEYTATEVEYGRVRVILDLPGNASTVTSAMMIPRDQLHDLLRARDAREHLRYAMDHSECEGEQRIALHDLQRFEERARNVTQAIANLVARQLSVEVEKRNGG